VVTATGELTVTTAHRRPWTALAVLVFLLAGMTVLASLGPGDPSFRQDPAGFIGFICAFGAFGLVGALIIWQRPGNKLGWVLTTIGLLAAWGASADTYVDLARDENLLYLVSVWISLWYWFPLLGLTLIFTPLLFPDGRPPSPRWRFVAWGATLALSLVVFLAAFRARIEMPGISIDNPVGIPGIEDPEESRLGTVLLGSFVLFLVLALASVVVRYIGSGGVQRQQIKWLLLATALSASMVFFEEITRIELDTEILFAISIALFPASIAVAIFRYRLYDIDVIINRALVYGSLTAMLALVYIGGVVGLQYAFRSLTGGESQLAIVASTLAIAGLFVPLRRRLQGFIDRRFYRRKYDAAKTLQEFGIRLRDETDLGSLSNDLVSVVRDTVQPEHVSLWLKESRRGPGESEMRP
jgi:hypothetical protein